MAKRSAVRQLVNEDHPETGTKYIVLKPIQGMKAQDKLRLRKYDKVLRKHCWFVEKNMPSHSK